MPFSYWTSAEYNINAQDPRKLFEKRTGSEIMALDSICQVNMQYYRNISSPKKINAAFETHSEAELQNRLL